MQELPRMRVPKGIGRRFAPWVLASWLFLWIAATLQPCCGMAFAAVPPNHLAHSTAQASRDCPDGQCNAQESRCAEATAHDAYDPDQATLPVDSLKFWDLSLTASPVSVPRMISEFRVLRVGRDTPPSPVPLYLRTLRLLI